MIGHLGLYPQAYWGMMLSDISQTSQVNPQPRPHLLPNASGVKTRTSPNQQSIYIRNTHYHACQTKLYPRVQNCQKQVHRSDSFRPTSLSQVAFSQQIQLRTFSLVGTPEKFEIFSPKDLKYSLNFLYQRFHKIPLAYSFCQNILVNVDKQSTNNVSE